MSHDPRSRLGGLKLEAPKAPYPAKSKRQCPARGEPHSLPLHDSRDIQSAPDLSLPDADSAAQHHAQQRGPGGSPSHLASLRRLVPRGPHPWGEAPE